MADLVQRIELLQSIDEVMRGIMDILRQELQKELKAQGHVNTGQLSNTIEYSVKRAADVIVGEMLMQDYWVYVDQGVKAENIPFTPGGGGGGGTSQYIQGLINYFLSKGLAGIEAKSAAFATATKHKREGMPTRDSFRFSSNGRRTEFVNRTLEANQARIDTLIEARYGDAVEAAFYDMLGRVARLNAATT